MSYSFSLKRPTKAEAIDALGNAFDIAMGGQPIHEADRQQAQAAAAGLIGALPDDATKDVYVAVSGSVSWANVDAAQVVTGVSFSFSASNQDRQ